MVPIARRMIWNEKIHFLITVSGIVFSVILMFFLSGIYEGVKNGSISYVDNNPAEVWLCQKNSTNLLRSSSFLPSSLQYEIQKQKGVDQVAGILRVITTARIKERSITLFVFGFNPKFDLGAPAKMVQGNSHLDSGEIIVDKSFAAKHKLILGDTLKIQNQNFIISGISSGTNAIVAQFAFTTLESAQYLLGIPKVVSFYLATLDVSTKSQVLVDSLKRRFSSLAVFNKQEFIRNNLEEMETGVLPILWTIALFGIIVSIVVITLILYSSILEKREDYALLKAMGASYRFIIFLVMRQSLLSSLIGFIIGLLLTIIGAPLLTAVVPEISLLFTFPAGIAIFIVSLVIGTIGSCTPIYKVMHIYPAEVFRA